MEEKFLEKVYEAQAFNSMAGGLGLAKTICRRKLLEVEIGDKTDLVLSIIAEIDVLMQVAHQRAIKAAE